MRPVRGLVVGLGLGLGLIAVEGCSDDETAPGVITGTQLMQRLSPKYCARLATCQPDAFQAEYGSQQACIDRFMKDVKTGENQDTTTEAHASECERKIEATRCDALGSTIDC